LPGSGEFSELAPPLLDDYTRRRRYREIYGHSAAAAAVDVTVRPLSTVEYTCVASVFHSRPWSD